MLLAPSTFSVLLNFVKIIEFGITYFGYLMNMNHPLFELAYAVAEHRLFLLLLQFNLQASCVLYIRTGVSLLSGERILCI